MSDFESLIVGRDKLTSIFGYWPSFHDAEVIDLRLWRGHADPHAKPYVFPVLTVKIHVMSASFECNRVEVLDALPCDAGGNSDA